MLQLYAKFRPLLFALEAERAHKLALNILRTGIVPRYKADRYPILEQRLWSRRFANPIGLAAGFDKDAVAMNGTARTGFGFIEIGTVTPQPQQGNPKPRIFRDIGSHSIINRMGFPNQGSDNAYQRLRLMRDKGEFPIPVGVNIGKNRNQTDACQDYVDLVEKFFDVADYLVINISSPNTPGLRDLQMRQQLQTLLDKTMAARQAAYDKMQAQDRQTRFDMPPLLVKLSPDLSEGEIYEVADICLRTNIDGLILTNTTTARPEFLPPVYRDEGGGLSGAPLSDMSTNLIRRFYKLTKGRLPIIGVGGVQSGQDAYTKLKAGASLIQLYSAFVFQGPAVVQKINSQLALAIEQDGFKNIKEVIGIEAN